MVNTLGFDFNDTFIDIGGLRFAVRLTTTANVYAPAPAATVVRRDSSSVSLEATSLAAAGGQLRSDGTLRLSVRSVGDRFVVEGGGSHPDEDCVSVVVLVGGVPATAFVAESANMGKHEFRDHAGIEAIHYPSRQATMPLVVAETTAGDWFVLSKDRKVRKKSLGAFADPASGDRLLVLVHREDRRYLTASIDLPAWHLGPLGDLDAIVSERCDDLAAGFGHTAFDDDDSARWVDDVKVVVNFHGEHWTGRVFNTFDRMADQLRWVCERIDGSQVLAFLAGWDGRYYRTYPEHRPGERLGGAAGLRRFVDTAHELGVKVVAMLGGPNLANFSFLREHGLEDAALKSEAGFPMVLDWTDWDGDLTAEVAGYIVNFGHPGFLEYMTNRAVSLIDDFGFDGLFLDGALRWSNAPDHSPFEGTITWAEAVKAAHPRTLLMAEDGYDALWSHFRLFATAWSPTGLGDALLRFTRQTQYLAYPAPNGSSGIHEAGFDWRQLDHAEPAKTIPTIALFDSSIETHGDVLAGQIEAHKSWSLVRSGPGRPHRGPGRLGNEEV